jgi:hypothetical protein
MSDTSFIIKREKQVSWFDTRQLLATGSQSLAASIIGSMSGRRELMAALEPKIGKPFDYSGQEELWLDYIADTGDGWNATTSVAWLAGRDGIVLDPGGRPTEQPIPKDCLTEGMPEPQENELLLPAGQLLLLGGDEVYPTASPDNYKHRFTDPLRCARWFQAGGRHVYSIPGNHDWYDGLTSFIRLFCQSEHARRWFGAWQAQQRRSYFSIKLPHNWWLWGVDMALEDDLDPPQYDYFREQAQALEKGDRLILSVPTPTWLRHPVGLVKEEDSALSRTSDKLDLIMRLPDKVGKDVDIPLVLTGDLHYYARHEAKLEHGKRHYIVCGLGGAFGLGTLLVPKRLKVQDAADPAKVADLKQSFPDREESVKLRRGVWKFPLKNPAFTMALTGCQALILWLMSAAQPNWIEQIAVPTRPFGQLCVLIGQVASAAFVRPSLLLWLLILILGFGLFASNRRPPGSPPWVNWAAWGMGIAHGLLQILGSLVCVWLAAQTIAQFGFFGFADEWKALQVSLGDKWATLLIAAPISYFYCGFLFGGYLWLAHKALKLHDQEVFSAQALEDHKGFLRMHFSREGLRIYPVGLNRHVAEWRGAPGVKLETLRAGVFRKVQKVTIPADAQRVVDPCAPLSPHLIEEPIFIPGAERE